MSNTFNSTKDLDDIPAEVLWVKHCQNEGIPMGASYYYKIIEDYPEHFPEETARRKKFLAIPEEVHEKYSEELHKLRDLIYLGCPDSPGILAQSMYPEECKAYNDFSATAINIYNYVKNVLHEKYYKQYGI